MVDIHHDAEAQHSPCSPFVQNTSILLDQLHFPQLQDVEPVESTLLRSAAPARLLFGHSTMWRQGACYTRRPGATLSSAKSASTSRHGSTTRKITLGLLPGLQAWGEGGGKVNTQQAVNILKSHPDVDAPCRSALARSMRRKQFDDSVVDATLMF